MEVPMESGVQLGQGPIKSGSNVPTPRVPSVPRHAHWFVLTLLPLEFADISFVNIYFPAINPPMSESERVRIAICNLFESGTLYKKTQIIATNSK